MSNLVDELKREHEVIADTLMRVKFLGVCSEGGQAMLLEARADLLEHLRKEDEGLYPALRKAAASDPAMRSELDALDKEMKEVTALALEFFDKYEVPLPEDTSSQPFCERLKRTLFARGGRDGLEKEFSEDFEKINRKLLERIRKEENTIYRMYEKLDIPV